MKMKLTIFATVGLLSLGCQAKAPEFQHARVHQLSTDQMSEIQKTISAATGSPLPRISSSAFADSHILVLERAIANTPKGRIATGRTMGKPETFHLLSNGKQCALLSVTSGQRYPLTFKCDLKSPEI
jgi:hypothetical protein